MFTTHRKVVAGDGLVGWWKLDEGSGTDAFDSSVSGNDGILINGVAWSTIDGETAADFINSDDRIRLGDILDNVVEGDDRQFTITAEINLDDIALAMVIAKVADSNCDSDQKTFYAAVAAGRMRFLYYCGDDTFTDYRYIDGTTNLLSASTTYHLAYVYDGTTDANNGLNRIKFYLDGVEDTHTIAGQNGALTGIRLSTAQLAIGGFVKPTGASCGTLFPNGRIRDVRIYDRILTQEEITSIANGEG